MRLTTDCRDHGPAVPARRDLVEGSYLECLACELGELLVMLEQGGEEVPDPKPSTPRPPDPLREHAARMLGYWSESYLLEQLRRPNIIELAIAKPYVSDPRQLSGDAPRHLDA